MQLSEAERLDISSDLLKFMMYCFARSNKKFLLNHHHKVIADKLMAVFCGSIKRLIINIPPRHSKTELAVVNFMAWCIGIVPDCEFIHVSYSKRLAANNTYNSRALVMSEGYQDVFPDVALKYDSKARDEWRTDKGGVVYAAGSEGTITGYGAGKLRSGFGGAVIVDDPQKAGEGDSEISRKNVINWYETTIESRLNNPDTPIIVIMQRLHEEDLSGWLLAGGTGEEWEHLKMPAVNEDGTPLWPYKHDIETLYRMERSKPYVFAGQYMQDPVPKSGGMVKHDWPKRYRERPSEFIRITQSWDTASKEKEINDPSVCTTWGETDRGHYLLDVAVMRADYPTLKRAVKSKYAQTLEKYNQAVTVLIEDKSSGMALIQDMRIDTDVAMTVIAINPVVDKVTRMSTASDHYEAGRVYHPEFAPWLADYENELFLFPLSKNDDQVDSASQYLNWATTKREIYIG